MKIVKIISIWVNVILGILIIYLGVWTYNNPSLIEELIRKKSPWMLKPSYRFSNSKGIDGEATDTSNNLISKNKDKTKVRKNIAAKKKKSVHSRIGLNLLGDKIKLSVLTNSNKKYELGFIDVNNNHRYDISDRSNIVPVSLNVKGNSILFTYNRLNRTWLRFDEGGFNGYVITLLKPNPFPITLKISPETNVVGMKKNRISITGDKIYINVEGLKITRKSKIKLIIQKDKKNKSLNISMDKKIRKQAKEGNKDAVKKLLGLDTK